MLGAYYRDKGEYKVYDKQKNIKNYNEVYTTYLNFVIGVALQDYKGDPNNMWMPDMVDATLNS